MKNKLISTENITLLLVLIIGILIAVIGYRNDPVITSKTTSDNAVESQRPKINLKVVYVVLLISGVLKALTNDLFDYSALAHGLFVDTCVDS